MMPFVSFDRLHYGRRNSILISMQISTQTVPGVHRKLVPVVCIGKQNIFHRRAFFYNGNLSLQTKVDLSKLETI